MLLEFTFVIGSMTGSGFKNERCEMCPFSCNRFAHSSAKRVSTKPGSAPTQQTSCISIIPTGSTTLVITRKFGPTMAILIKCLEINWIVS